MDGRISAGSSCTFEDSASACFDTQSFRSFGDNASYKSFETLEGGLGLEDLQSARGSVEDIDEVVARLHEKFIDCQTKSDTELFADADKASTALGTVDESRLGGIESSPSETERDSPVSQSRSH